MPWRGEEDKGDFVVAFEDKGDKRDGGDTVKGRDAAGTGADGLRQRRREDEHRRHGGKRRGRPWRVEEGSAVAGRGGADRRHGGKMRGWVIGVQRRRGAMETLGVSVDGERISLCVMIFFINPCM
jgi:hypothetical protein